MNGTYSQNTIIQINTRLQILTHVHFNACNCCAGGKYSSTNQRINGSMPSPPAINIYSRSVLGQDALPKMAVYDIPLYIIHFRSKTCTKIIIYGVFHSACTGSVLYCCVGEGCHIVHRLLSPSLTSTNIHLISSLPLLWVSSMSPACLCVCLSVSPSYWPEEASRVCLPHWLLVSVCGLDREGGSWNMLWGIWCRGRLLLYWATVWKLWLQLWWFSCPSIWNEGSCVHFIDVYTRLKAVTLFDSSFVRTTSVQHSRHSFVNQKEISTSQ